MELINDMKPVSVSFTPLVYLIAQSVLTAISRPGYPNNVAAPAANVGFVLAKLHTFETRLLCD